MPEMSDSCYLGKTLLSVADGSQHGHCPTDVNTRKIISHFSSCYSLSSYETTNVYGLLVFALNPFIYLTMICLTTFNFNANLFLVHIKFLSVTVITSFKGDLLLFGTIWGTQSPPICHQYFLITISSTRYTPVGN